MRVLLEHVDARGLAVDLPPLGQGPQRRVVVASATGLKGALEHSPERLVLSDAQAEHLALGVLSLCFGSVQLGEPGGASFAQATASLEQAADSTRFELAALKTQAKELTVQVGDVLVQAAMALDAMRLSVHGGEGRISAEQANFGAFRLRVGKLSVTASGLSAERLVVSWGEAGFRLEASALSAPSLELVAGPFSLRATDVAVHNLAVHGSEVSFSAATMAQAGLQAALGDATGSSPAPEPKQPRDAAAPRVFDYRLLDGLTGALHVDAAVDMTVPILGRRRATHELRLRVEDGSVDYRELENDLAGLEESLLDFSVREAALVLELGLPLLPTRGLGKPLLVWDLGSEDLALAHKRRVRLSVLPNVRLADAQARARDDGERESSSSMFALRRLSLENLQLNLTLYAVAQVESAIRKLSIEKLALSGAIHHLPDGGAGEGEVRGEMSGLETSIAGLPLGSHQLDVGRLYLSRLSGLRIAFSGLRPTQVSLSIDKLALTNAALVAAHVQTAS